MGRDDELTLLSQLLSTRDTSTVLYVGAPTGMGKTALLEAFAGRAFARGRAALRLSCAEIAPAHARIEAALASALEASGPAPVILLDDFELHARLERWYRTNLLPRLPTGTLFVLAGRHRLEQAWNDVDSPWRFHSCELGPLDVVARQHYAAALGVTSERAEALTLESHGVPLLMRQAMEIASGRRCTTGDLGAHDSALDALYSRMLRDVPTEDHRRALWAIALPRRLSPRLLAASLESAGTREYYRWLARRAYVTTHDDGLSIGDPFRQAVLGDLLRTAPAFYRSVLWLAGQHLMALLESQRTFDDRHAVVSELLYMQRRPDGGGHRMRSGTLAMPMRPGDVAGARQLIMDGTEDPRAGAAVVDRLLSTPTEFAVTHDGDLRVTGVIRMVRFALGAALPPEGVQGAPDPAVRAALSALERSAAHEPPARRRKPDSQLAIICTVWLPPGATEDSPNLAAAYRVLSTHTLATPDLRMMALMSDPDSPLGVLVQEQGLMRTAPSERGLTPLLLRDNERDPPLKWLRGQLATAVAQHGGDAGPSPDGAKISRNDFSNAVRETLQRIAGGRAPTPNPLVAVALTYHDGSASGAVRNLIKQGLELLAASAHSRQDANRLRKHYGIDRTDSAGIAEHGPDHTSATQLAVAEDRLIATLWQEYVQRVRAGTPS